VLPEIQNKKSATGKKVGAQNRQEPCETYANKLPDRGVRKSVKKKTTGHTTKQKKNAN